MSAQRYIRFQAEALQDAFLAELERNVGASAAIDAAHRVGSAQFPWHFLQWNTERFSECFASALRQAGLPFFIEYHESARGFVVRRADQVRPCPARR